MSINSQILRIGNEVSQQSGIIDDTFAALSTKDGGSSTSESIAGKTPIENNTANMQAILERINALPNGGMKLNTPVIDSVYKSTGNIYYIKWNAVQNATNYVIYGKSASETSYTVITYVATGTLYNLNSFLSKYSTKTEMNFAIRATNAESDIYDISDPAYITYIKDFAITSYVTLNSMGTAVYSEDAPYPLIIEFTLPSGTEFGKIEYIKQTNTSSGTQIFDGAITDGSNNIKTAYIPDCYQANIYAKVVHAGVTYYSPATTAKLSSRGEMPSSFAFEDEWNGKLLFENRSLSSATYSNYDIWYFINGVGIGKNINRTKFVELDTSSGRTRAALDLTSYLKNLGIKEGDNVKFVAQCQEYSAFDTTQPVGSYSLIYEFDFVYTPSTETDANVPCLIATTKILMDDGSTKDICDIKQGDKIMSWDLENNYPITVKVLAIIKTGTESKWIVHTFENGNQVTVFQRHHIYNVNAQMPLFTDEWREGEYGISSDGENVVYCGEYPTETLGYVDRYTLITENNLYFADGILCGHHAKSKHMMIGRGHIEESEEALALYKKEAQIYLDWRNAKFTGATLTPEVLKSRGKVLKWRKEMKELKDKLSTLDHKTNKYIEGEIDDQEWKDIVANRKAWRNRINQIEKDIVYDRKKLKDSRAANRKTKSEVFQECYKMDMEFIRNQKSKI